MSKKIVQTAGRSALGEFAPDFAHYNDDILFGENWNNPDIDVKTRCIVTVVALMAQGICDSSLKLVNIPVGVKHWHGAGKGQWFSHLAVEVPAKNGKTQWCEPVSEEDYERAII